MLQDGSTFRNLRYCLFVKFDGVHFCSFHEPNDLIFIQLVLQRDSPTCECELTLDVKSKQLTCFMQDIGRSQTLRIHSCGSDRKMHGQPIVLFLQPLILCNNDHEGFAKFLIFQPINEISCVCFRVTSHGFNPHLQWRITYKLFVSFFHRFFPPSFPGV